MKSIRIGVVLGLTSLMSLTLWSQQTGNNEPTQEEIQSAIKKFRNRDTFLDDETFLSFVREYKLLQRVTDVPYKMSSNTSGLCIELASNPKVHGDRFCDVYVNHKAKDPIAKGNATYPVDSIVVKVKYPDRNRSKIELFTVMRKMKVGYDSKHGDWEYSVIDAEATHVLARGHVESCVSCHDEYAKSDFVTRTYLKKPAAK